MHRDSRADFERTESYLSCSSPSPDSKSRPGPFTSTGAGLLRHVSRDYRGFDAYGLPPSAFEMSVIARCARTLLPASSSGGETTAMPNLPGETAMIPPPTPLLAGSPV